MLAYANEGFNLAAPCWKTGNDIRGVQGTAHTHFGQFQDISIVQFSRCDKSEKP